MEQDDVIARAREYLSPVDVDVLVYHDPCADGLAAAAAATIDRSGTQQLELIPYDIHRVDKAKDTLLDMRDRNIVFVDCAPSEELLNDIRARRNTVIVIDHHRSNARNLPGVEGCFFDFKRSGCMLAWDYFHADEGYPALIRHIGMRDIGIYDQPEHRLVGYALAAARLKLDALRGILRDDPIGLIKAGKEIAVKVDERAAELAPRVDTATIGGVEYQVKIAAVQDHMFVNELSEFLYAPGVDFTILHHPTPEGKIRLYFRTDRPDLDLSELADTIGGGGHPQASGAMVDEAPWGLHLG